MASDTDALSALLGERSDRQVRLMVAATLMGPSLLVQKPKEVEHLTPQQYLDYLIGAALATADRMIAIDKASRTGDTVPV